MAEDDKETYTEEEVKERVDKVKQNLKSDLQQEKKQAVQQERQRVLGEVSGQIGIDETPSDVDEFEEKWSEKKKSFQPSGDDKDIDVKETQEFQELQQKANKQEQTIQSLKSEKQDIEQSYQEKLKDKEVNNELQNAVQSVGADLDLSIDPEDLQMLYKNKRSLGVNDSGVAVYNEDGTKKFDDEGNPFALKDDVRKFVTEKGYAEASGGTGGGSTPKASTKKTKSDMSDAERAQYIDDHGTDAYLDLPKE